MAQTFPITTARHDLGFTPSTGVRANIDVRQGNVGAAVGQALIAGAGTLQKIQAKRQQMQDARSSVEAGSLIQSAIDENKAFRNTEADTSLWSKDLQQRFATTESQIGQLEMSDDTRALMGAKFQAASREAQSRSLIAETSREAEDTRGDIILDVTEAVKSGDDIRKKEAIGRFASVSGSLWDATEARSVLTAAIEAGQKGKQEDLINGVHAAIEAGGVSGDFSVARQLATSEGIPEKDQTILRNTIRANESVFDNKQESIQESNTIDFVLKIANGRSLDTPQSLQVNASEINNALRDNKITLKQRDDLLKRLGTTDIITNRVRQAELYTQSLNIWRGTISKPEYDKALNASANKLDDQAYDLLAKSGADTLRSSQAEALSRADTEGRRLLVEIPDDDLFAKILAQEKSGLPFDAAKLFEDTANEERQLQFWSLSRYNAELREWIKENPDKLGKDFFQFSESLKHQYWSRSLEEIRKLRERTEGEFIVAKFLAENPLDLKAFTEDAPPAKAPPRIEIVNRLGVTSQVSLSTLSKALDLGHRIKPGTSVSVARNTTDKTQTVGGKTVEPGQRIVSFDGGQTWRKIP